MKNFSELGVSEQMSAVLAGCDFTQPTEIQEQAIPIALSGRDLLASAETGSGKTAAYALPIIELLQKSKPGPGNKKPRALVLVPTRELAVQVAAQFLRFGSHMNLRVATIYGGAGYDRQIRALHRGVDVIVATPGRLFDHMQNNFANLSMIQALVLDEADRLLDMGFMPQVRKIVAKTPEKDKRQTLMFSATINKLVEQTAAEFLRDPAMIQINTGRIEPSAIEQRILHVSEAGKQALLMQLIEESNNGTVLVFARTRRKASYIRNRLCAANVLAEEIHSDISQNRREKTIAGYREGRFSVLVATDIAARGLDIPTISHVVNYDLPDSPADYVHRIGRTGRAGRSGIAVSFVSQEQRHLIRSIERETGCNLDSNLGPDAPPPSLAKRKPAVRRFRPRKRFG
ncbi:MAG: DEAD/DEAH box helicase [Candidatus Obscuribacterales bacterium]|nr:DEAD/DEAH box helicase [Candidatus Obscuribacterales bacterium]